MFLLENVKQSLDEKKSGNEKISQKLLLWGMTILAVIVAGGHILEEAFARWTSDFFSTFLFL